MHSHFFSFAPLLNWEHPRICFKKKRPNLLCNISKADIYTSTQMFTHKSDASLRRCVGRDATLIRDNGQTREGWQRCHTVRGGREGWRSKEAPIRRNKEEEEGKRNGHGVNKTCNTSAEAIQTKGRKWKRAHGSSCQLKLGLLLPAPCVWTPSHKLEESPLHLHTIIFFFFTSGRVDAEIVWHRTSTLHRILRNLLELTSSRSPAQPDWWHYTNGRTWPETSAWHNVPSDSFGLCCLALFGILLEYACRHECKKKILVSNGCDTHVTLCRGWIAGISVLKSSSSMLPSSNRKHFQSVLKLHWSPIPISYLLAVATTRNNCC